MKKLLTNILVALLLNGLVSAAPGFYGGTKQVSGISKMEAGGSYLPAVAAEPEFHPMDIFGLKFN